MWWCDSPGPSQPPGWWKRQAVLTLQPLALSLLGLLRCQISDALPWHNGHCGELFYCTNALNFLWSFVLVIDWLPSKWQRMRPNWVRVITLTSPNALTSSCGLGLTQLSISSHQVKIGAGKIKYLKMKVNSLIQLQESMQNYFIILGKDDFFKKTSEIIREHDIYCYINLKLQSDHICYKLSLRTSHSQREHIYKRTNEEFISI